MIDPVKQERLLDLLDLQLREELTGEQHQELESLLLDDPNAQQLYHDYLELEHSLNQHYEVSPLLQPTASDKVVHRTGNDQRWLKMVALGLIFCVAGYLALQWWDDNRNKQAQSPPPELAPTHVASFTQLADARFLDQSLWKMGDQIEPHQEITLRSGLIKLTAIGGAELILEGPAVFEWKSPLELVLKYGHCSVHVPQDADKIEVQTPSSRVVDLGTSFAINVTESGESEVQLIEGMADVYQPENTSDTPERLTRGEARQYRWENGLNSVSIPYNEKTFRGQLPDRVVAYQAHQTGNGIDELEQVTVQRGGRLYEYDVSELIGIELIHFRGIETPGYLTAPLSAPDGGAALLAAGQRHLLLDSDHNLSTGVINLGGEMSPLQSSPLIKQENPSENTAGMAIRFDQPVINALGPDIVLFDLHVIVHNEEGDPFQIAPLEWREGLKSVTISKFDITLSSPEAQLLVPFRLVKLEEQAYSLDELEQSPIKDSLEHIVRARVLAVGLDLSDLGYAPGDKVNGIFLQDLMDDSSHLDPVFIGGLPTISP
ncbi:MAG: hypothetical protein KDA65_17525 [Planctomycetaceae bacterium]|nr:hypothetical protein [Planctomycetaceae bacterium]